MPQVRAPDGSIVNFPDGMAPAAISAVMARHYGGPTPNQRAAQAQAQRDMNPNNALIGPPNPLANGFFFGHAPEVSGAIAAVRTGIQHMFGGGPSYSAADAYNATTAASKAAATNIARTHPIVNALGQLVGGVANPISLAGGEWIAGARGAGMIPMALRSAAVGGVTGGIAGGPKGALEGAAVGGALPIGMNKVVAPLVRRVSNVAVDASNGARQLFAPVAAEAPPSAQNTRQALQQIAAQMRMTRATPATLAAVTGKPLTTAEAIGKPAVVSLGGLARRPGMTADMLATLLSDRAHTAPQRILGDFATASGITPEAAQGNIEDLISARQAAVKPMFDAALGSPEPVMTQGLASLAQRPVIAKAIANVGQDMLNAGQDPTAAGLKLDPVTGAHVLATPPPSATPAISVGGDQIGMTPAIRTQLGLDPAPPAPVTEQQPTAATWDAVRKAVGRQVERNPVTGAPLPDSQSAGNFGVRTANQDLSGELRSAIPGYSDALDASGDYLKMQDAFKKGQSLVLHPNVSADTFGGIYRGLDEASQDAFKGGIANKLNELAQNGRLTPRALSAPRIQDKLSAVLGEQPTSDFFGNLNQEAQMAASGNRMMPGVGSPSMEYLNDAATTEGGPNAVTAMMHAAHNPLGMIARLAGIGQQVPTTAPVRNEIGRLLMQPPQQTAQEIGGLFGAQPPQSAAGLFGLTYPSVAGLLAQSQPAS